MMQPPFASLRFIASIAAGVVLALVALPSLADPPARAARISLVSGTASFSPAGSDEWVQARINRPIWIGDRLWSGDGRVELQIGGASVRMAPRTSLQVLNFDDRIAQFELTQGSVALHVRSIDRDQSIEFSTPSFAFVTHEEGDYRIDVERDLTAVSARRGSCDIYGSDVAYRIDRRERFAFYSPDLRDYDAGPLPPPDAFERWSRERAQREDRSPSARYVSPELVGFVDLDGYGDWRVDATYGNVWVPRVEASWAPYRNGNWTWVDPWGWTWVDDAPWGYAPSHYGRWTRIGSLWAWVPGPRNVRPVYSPALVAWVGGDNFSLTVSSGRTRGIGWFPLAPGEVWRPTYEVSREYFTRVNVANTVVNNTTVVNVYNTRNDVRIDNVEYRFRSAPAAVTAVPVEAFVQSRPVQLSHAQLAANATAQANVLRAPAAQPVVRSMMGSSPAVQARPPAESMQRAVVARTAPAPAAPTIEQRAVLIREGTPVSRQVLDRSAPQAPQPVAAPASQPSAQAPAGQAPAGTVAGQLRGNVRVVDAEKGAPKPLPPAPEGGGRAARNEAEKGRTPQAAQPSQAVPPGIAPAPAPAVAPRQPEGVSRELPAARGEQPGAAGRGERGPRGDAPPKSDATPPKPAPPSEATPPKAVPQPAPAPQPAPSAPAAQVRPAPAAPAAERPGAEPRSREDPTTRRLPEPAQGDERRARPAPPQPVPVSPPAAGTPRPAEAPSTPPREGRPPQPQQTPAAAPPLPAEAQPPRGEARRAPSSTPPQAARPGGDERRAAPPAPQSPPRPAEAPPKPAPPAAAAPAVKPAPAPAGGAPEKARQERDRDKAPGNRDDKDREKEREKDREKEREKDKDKNKDKN